MLSLLLMVLPALTTSISLASVDGEQGVRISKNGEFIARYYPQRALKAREQGKVGFRLVVEPDGSLGSCEVTATSGSNALDNETCELIVRYARLTPVRNADGRAVRATQDGYINWRLPKHAPQLASAAASTGRDPDRIICRKSIKTGSLISRTKQCMSAKQWAEQRRIALDQAEKIIGSGYCEGKNDLPCTAD
jgi:TonB family protein